MASAGRTTQGVDVFEGEREAVLRVRDVVVRYGRVSAVRGVSLDLAPGEVRALVGPNGAGKTSLLRAICGLVRTESGEITMSGRDLAGVGTADCARLGLTLVPEGRGIFVSMSVHENLTVAGRGDRAARERATQLYEVFPLLAKLKSRRAGLLSGGEQQLVALARALMIAPKVLLLDEPSMGLSPVAVQGVFEVLRNLGRTGPAVLLVEQNARLALRLAEFIYVMKEGVIVAAGSADAMESEGDFRDAYLGTR